VVRVGLAAFARNRSFVVHGAANFFIAFLARLFSRQFVARIGARMMRPRELAPPALRGA
jgi:short-subunit dehydrogenase